MCAASGIARTARPAAWRVPAKSPRTAVSSSTSKTDVDTIDHDTARARWKGAPTPRARHSGREPGMSGNLTVVVGGTPSSVGRSHAHAGRRLVVLVFGADPRLVATQL